ncbi:hypothetical protein BLOT_008294 [Blomia tropicalis]|nr:hypothetical protein BLOT_008294 [Blomia tropicalis]
MAPESSCRTVPIQRRPNGSILPSLKRSFPLRSGDTSANTFHTDGHLQQKRPHNKGLIRFYPNAVLRRDHLQDFGQLLQRRMAPFWFAY